MGAEWWPWRIEVWHEVVHQVSDMLGVYDSQKPPTHPLRGPGHGAGWDQAVAHVASHFGISTDILEELL